MQNVTLIGVNGRPTIRSENPETGIYLFDNNVQRSHKTVKDVTKITIQIENIWLTRIGIARIKDPSATLVVQIANCLLSELVHHNNLSTIDSTAARTTIFIKNSTLYNISKVLNLNGPHVEIKMETSLVLNNMQVYSGEECPQFITVGQSESVTGLFVKSMFKRISLIDLKSTNKGKSNISIISSTFDDERLNAYDSVCSSAIKLYGATTYITNTWFLNIGNTNSLIRMISSHIIFKKCRFHNIISNSNFFAIYSKSSASFYNCRLENNVVFGDHSPITLKESQGIFKNCTFENNTVSGRYGHGGVISALSGAVMDIVNCFFKWNKATHSGGAIFSYQPFSVIISQSSFMENHAKFSGGAIKHSGNKLFVYETTFANNIAKTGGAICTDEQADIISMGCFFKANNAHAGGGAVAHLGNKLTGTNNTFEDNSAVGSKNAIGGAVFTYRRSNVNLTWCYFMRNEAVKGGGALCHDGIKLYITNTKFENNSALTSNYAEGGALYIGEESFISISCCYFKLNKATVNGGAVLLSTNKFPTITNTTFDQNAVEGSQNTAGGAIHTLSNLVISWCSFKGNKATYYGGAILCGNELSVRNTTFEHNIAIGGKYSMGGALFTSTQSNVNLYWCNFRKNRAAFFGGAVFHGGNKLFVSNTAFEGNVATGRINSMGGALFTSSKQSNVKLFRCSFTKNKALRFGGAIFHTGSKLSAIYTNFKENAAVESSNSSGGALFMSNSQSVVNVSWCYFKKNTASRYGGAVVCTGRKIHIRNSTFAENIVSSVSAEGGALYTGILSNVEICHSSFKGNIAQWAGGAISSMGGGNLSIKKSWFQTILYSRGQHFFGGEVIYSSGYLFWEDVSIQDMNKYNTPTSLIVHFGIGFKIKETYVTCSQGKNIIAILPEDPSFPVENVVMFFTVSCSSCPPHSYSLLAGKIGPQITDQTHIRCYDCPVGGNCTNGQIKAAYNFWGYLVKSDSEEVRFSPCPFGYCCVGTECEHCNSCATGREGTLCGHCNVGLTENILTTNCMKPEHCRHLWILSVVFLGGIVYILLFFYLKEAAKLCTNLLIPKQVLVLIKHIFTNTNVLCNVKETYRAWKNRYLEGVLITNDICCESSGHEEVHVELLDTKGFLDTSYPNKSDSDLFPGLLKVIIFFYQASVLFKVDSKGNSYGFLHILQELTVTLFNLRTDGLFFQNFSWCPFDNIHPVLKLLFKTSFILCLFIALFFIFLMLKILRLCKNDSNYNSQAKYSRLYCCVLRLTLISYATITVTCFSLLSCVNLGSIGKVLYIDGSIECYQWWQFIVIAIICIWIVPYPIAVYGTSWLLHRKKLSAGWFLLSTLLPFTTIIHWMYICITSRKKTGVRSELETENILNEHTNEMLDVLEGPFRKYHGSHINNNYRLPWESILIGRRLVLIIIRAFTTNLINRLYLMQFFSILFLVHHVYVRPFSSKFLNSVETLTLIILTVICALNILPAYIYMNPLTLSSFMQELVEIFRHIETILMLLFPFIIGCGVIILGVLRIFQFIIWIFSICVRLIRWFGKRKTL